MRKGIILKNSGKYSIKSLPKLIPKRNKLDKIKYILLPIMGDMYNIYLPLIPTELMYSTKITVEMIIGVYSVDYETEEIIYLDELYDDREFDDYISFINYIYTIYKSDGFNIIFSSLKSDSFNVEIFEFLKVTRLDIKFYKDNELKDKIFYEAEDPDYQNYYINGVEAINQDLISLLDKIIAPTYNPYSQPKRLESILFNDLEYEFLSINDLKDNNNYCDFILYPIYEFNSFIMISPEEIENLSKNYSSRLYILTLPKVYKFYNDPQVMNNIKNLLIRDEISGELEVWDYFEYSILYYDRILTLIPYIEYICSYLEFVYMNYLDDIINPGESNILIKVNSNGRRLSDCDYYLLSELKDSNNINSIISKLLEGEDND